MIEAKNQKFIELARLLAPDDESLAEDVRETLEDGAKDEEAWEMIIDGLFVRDKLVSIGQEQTPAEVADDIDALLDSQPTNPQRWAWVNLKERRQDLPHIFLKEVQQQVIGPGQILAILRDHTAVEVYPTCLVAAADYPRIEKVLGELGYGSVEKAADMQTPRGVY